MNHDRSIVSASHVAFEAESLSASAAASASASPPLLVSVVSSIPESASASEPLSVSASVSQPVNRHFVSSSQAALSQSASSVVEEPDIMVIPAPVRPPRLTNFIKPYVLKMHFTNKFVQAQVVHTPTATVAAAASSQEKLLRPNMENTRDVAAAAKIGKLLAERLLQKGIPAVTVYLNREQRYHGKVKAVIDSIREGGVNLI